MAADDHFLASHVALMAGSGLIYMANTSISSELAMQISWYAIGPIAVVYSNMLVKFWKQPKNQKQPEHITLPMSLQLGKTLPRDDTWERQIAHAPKGSLSTISDRRKVPPATKLSCIVAMVCSLAAQFIAAAHTQQAAKVVLENSTNTRHPTQAVLFCHLIAACISWICYAASICVFELECLDNFQQNQMKDQKSADLSII